MVRFLIWLKENVQVVWKQNISVDRKLYELRSEQCLFQGISFDTIAGYQEHGAIVHYEATPETSSILQAKGLLLLDSGAQYLDGTTDITRTIVLGEVSDEQKTDYTLVLKGFIALSQAEFPQGTCGTQLDVLARQLCGSRHQLRTWHRTWRRAFPKCTRRASSNTYEPYPHSFTTRHDNNERARHLQIRTVWHPYRKYNACSTRT